MTRRVRALLFALAAGAAAAAGDPPASAAPPPSGFRYERPVRPGGKGPNHLAVDVPLLAGAAPDLRDLRLFDEAGRELPHLLIAPPPPAPRFITARILPVRATKEESGFEGDLGEAALVDLLHVDGIPAPFLKRCRLEGSGDRTHWTLLVAEGTLFDLPGEGLRCLDLGFAPGELRYLRVTWNDRTSGRVPPPVRAAARPAAAPVAAPPLRAALSFEKRESEPGRSRYRLRLPGVRLPVAALELTVGSGNVLRQARVTEPRLSRGQVLPVPLGASTLRRAERADAVAADLRIPIQPPEGTELDLVVEDGDNPPLPLTIVEAEMAPLPWIYFESPGTEPLAARFGDGTLSRPRYDLEARRADAAQEPALPALWGDRRDLAPAGEAPASSPLPTAGAPLDATRFRYARGVTARPGLNALVLDAAVLAHARDLGELRLLDGEGRQVPYLLERRDEPLSLTLPAPGRRTASPGQPGRSSYVLALPFDSLPACRLVLTTGARVFERPVSIERERRVPDDPRAKPRVETLASAVWRHAAPETPPPALTLELPPPEAAELRLVVDEGDNSPLPLLPPRLLLGSYRLRFFASGQTPLTLLYGQAGLGAPRYDLTLYAPRLAGTAANEAAMAPETAPAPSRASAPTTAEKTFWGALAAAVVTLLALVARLVVRRPDAPTGTGPPPSP